jgi:hypothetical protein
MRRAQSMGIMSCRSSTFASRPSVIGPDGFATAGIVRRYEITATTSSSGHHARSCAGMNVTP